jgi:hypothetical protein
VDNSVIVMAGFSQFENNGRGYDMLYSPDISNFMNHTRLTSTTPSIVNSNIVSQTETVKDRMDSFITLSTMETAPSSSWRKPHTGMTNTSSLISSRNQRSGNENNKVRPNGRVLLEI